MYRTAFTPDEATHVERELEFLSSRLLLTPGAKVEEYHWAEVYRRARGLSQHRWSNLPFKDYLHDGLGVEFKLLQRTSPSGDQGRSLMHPSASRQLDYDESAPPDAAKDIVLKQWGITIDRFRTEVEKTKPGSTPNIRWGVLLWRPDFRQFLYFEEDILKPNPDDYYAKWSEQRHRGKPTRNLHIFEKNTDTKKFSVTLPAKGAKLQPYFTVPTIDEGAHLFTIDEDALRTPLWISNELYRELEIGELSAAEHDEWLRKLIGRSDR